MATPLLHRKYRGPGIITARLLTQSGSTVGATSYATGSVTPVAHRLVLAAIEHHPTVTPSGDPPPALTGCGLTWVEVDLAEFDVLALPEKRLFVFRAMGAAPTAGAVTIDFGGPKAQDHCMWSLVEFDGVDQTGADGAGAVVQSDTAAGNADTSGSVTLAAFADARNVGYGAFAIDINSTITPGGGSFGLHDQGITAPTGHLQTQAEAGDPVVAASWASADWGAVALELKAA